MKSLKKEAKKIIGLSLLMVFAICAKGQETKTMAVSIQGGPNMFFGNAFPENLTSFSFAGTFDIQFNRSIGLISKIEKGSLTGSQVLANGTYIFDAKVDYTSFMVTPYLSVTNILLGENSSRLIELKAFGGVGIISGKYTINDNPDVDPRYYYGTENNPNVLFPLLGGGLAEFRITPRLSAIAEFTGYLEYTDKLDGVAYEAAPAGSDLEHGDALGWFDNYLTIEFGVKYYLTKAASKKKKSSYRKSSKNLPSSILNFQGADGMEKGDY